MVKPKFKLALYPDHTTLGKRRYLEPRNNEAWDMLRARDAGIIPDFPCVVYECDFKLHLLP